MQLTRKHNNGVDGRLHPLIELSLPHVRRKIETSPHRLTSGVEYDRAEHSKDTIYPLLWATVKNTHSTMEYMTWRSGDNLSVINIYRQHKQAQRAHTYTISFASGKTL